ncbi:uncharacterized protein LAJ45_01499 [Morchella importuna]|uniref:uncharacterized protein n=1 Tax=Morchella importuna TaxID=1174673 RepID=UPI001E8D74AE|nr:uncharacterized protein LAJ45_01499 [Morchella importuna]KAH8154966.1 hypothetical protein LAJ45_01499 [Morchella importuna]
MGLGNSKRMNYIFDLGSAISLKHGGSYISSDGNRAGSSSSYDDLELSLKICSSSLGGYRSFQARLMTPTS